MTTPVVAGTGTADASATVSGANSDIAGASGVAPDDGAAHGAASIAFASVGTVAGVAQATGQAESSPASRVVIELHRLNWPEIVPVSPVLGRILKSGLPPIDRDRPIARRSRTKLRAGLKRFFRAQAVELADQVVALAPTAKAEGSGIPIGILAGLPGLDLSAWEREIPRIVGPILEAMFGSGAEAGLRQIGLFDKAIGARVRERAREWAAARAAEMVGMRVVAGMMVPNPDAAWRITDVVRIALRDRVRQAIENGASTGALADSIRDDFAFSGARAEMVARTEVAAADVSGTIRGYRESGIVKGKRWITAKDSKVSAECEACERQGVVAIDGLFVTGRDAPPNHPNCRCDVLPVFGDEMPAATAAAIIQG